MVSRLQSVLKALSWRVLATLTTAFLTIFLTSSTEVAAKVAPVDAVLKIAAFYAHERIWLGVPIAKHSAQWRWLAKAMTWKVFAVSLTMLLAFLVTHSVSFALKIGPMDFAAKTLLYFAHEAAWDQCAPPDNSPPPSTHLL
eukprot:TRINITY_DN37573_c0_g1_i1.p1 TRINITY_DN37573_c0_g1~~TRINITY_DN37573_c0_g1_i1.p1  ORF type:complete len:141 (+),score=48.40 TRINITY_DN37573_c0_g1_i1:75-497(+)